MKNWPLRVKLTLWSAFVVGLALLGSAVAVGAHLYLEQVQGLDAALRKEARGFFRAFRARPKDWEPSKWVAIIFADERETRVVEVLGPEGATIYRSSGLKQRLLDAAPGTKKQIGTARVTPVGRVRLGRFEKHGLVLLLGAEMHDIDDMVIELIPGFLIVLPLIVLTVGAGGWWIARKALKPVEAITTIAERITSSDLHQRLPESVADDEIGRLSRVLNQMIERIDARFQEIVRFTADASHELRTPLAVISGEIESALLQGPDILDAERVLTDLLGEVRRLSSIVDNLMLLARSDAGRMVLNRINLDFSAAVEDVVLDAEILAEPRTIHIDTEIASGLMLYADPARIRQVLLNLFDNAVKYNQEEGTVRIRVFESAGRVRLTIGNAGAGIPSGQAGKLFERFYRGDPARERTIEGSGLGLSICREIVRAHGGELTLARSDAEWTEFALALPQSPLGTGDAGVPERAVLGVTNLSPPHRGRVHEAAR